jgi:hypothetical protein
MREFTSRAHLVLVVVGVYSVADRLHKVYYR